MIEVFTWKMTEEESEVVNALLRAALKDKEPGEIKITELITTSKPLIDPNCNCIITLGVRAYNIIRSFTDKIAVALPPPAKLTKKKVNSESRETAFKVLKSIKLDKISLDSELILTDKDLEKLYLKQLIAIKDTMKKKKMDHWSLSTPTGMTIAILKDSDTKIKKYHDIEITFEELFAAKLAMDVLQIEKFSIVTPDL